jgi:hypothetical protein
MKKDYRSESILSGGACAVRRGLVSGICSGLAFIHADVCEKINQGIDDADFNMHMSNSSYAKCLDSLRLPLAKLPNLFRAGAWIPLAGVLLPILSECRLSILLNWCTSNALPLRPRDSHLRALRDSHDHRCLG